MGFFSMNEHSNLSANFDFPVLEGYDSTTGAGLALVEGYQNDFALFTAAVQADMSEMLAVKEGADVVSIQEASIEGAWNAIKEFFKKLGAKIKAIFTAFIAKIESYVTKDTKAYVKKYEKSIRGKDFKDMKCKYCEIKKDINSVIIYPQFVSDNVGLYNSADKDDTDREDIVAEFYKNISKGQADTAKEYDEWFHDEMFDSEEEKDDWDLGQIMTIANKLSSETKTIKDAKTSMDKILTNIGKIIKEIDKDAKKFDDLYKDSKDGKITRDSEPVHRYGFSVNADNAKKGGEIDNTNYRFAKGNDLGKMQTTISRIRTRASIFQEVTLHQSQTIMKELKFKMAQEKRVFAKAVAYKSVKENTLLNAIEECAFDEAMEYLDNPCIA